MKNHRTPRRTGRAVLTALLLAGVAACFGLALAPQQLLEGAGTLLAPRAFAAEGAPAHAADGPTTGSTEAAETSGTLTGGTGSIFGSEPLESLALSLKRRQRELDERAAHLAREEQRLETLRKEIEQSLARSQQVLKQMEQLAGNAAAQRDKELMRWIKIYEGMPPAQAGQVLGQLDLDFARELLAKMDPKKASKILAAFPPEKAVELGKLLREKTTS